MICRRLLATSFCKCDDAVSSSTALGEDDAVEEEEEEEDADVDVDADIDGVDVDDIDDEDDEEVIASEVASTSDRLPCAYKEMIEEDEEGQIEIACGIPSTSL